MAVYVLPELNHAEGQRYAIYGTGEVAKQYCNQLRKNFGYDSVAFFIESHPIGKEFMSVPLYDPNELLQLDYKGYKYIVTSFASMNLMIDTLISKGISSDQILRAKGAKTNVYIRDDYPMIREICYYPKVNRKEKLLDIYRRVKWYMPKSGENSASVYIDTDIREGGKPGNVVLVSDSDIQDYLKTSDIVLVWDKESLDDDVLKEYISKIYCVDETFYSVVESNIYRKVYYHCLSASKQEYYTQLSKINYENMYIKNKDKKEAYIFGTGPSIENAYGFDFSNGFNIVCNSIVKNKGLLRKINPDLLVFADPVFHFSPCEYAQKFREDVLETVSEFDCYCLTLNFTVPLMLAHYPELRDRIIGIPINSRMNFPDLENFYVKSSSNILTLFMIPVASSICNDINILGCDGRQKGETYFWKHNNDTQYNDLMKTVFDMHPSFFRDRVYEDYYKEHCEYLQLLIEYGESLGKKYRCLTPTYIPALKERRTECIR